MKVLVLATLALVAIAHVAMGLEDDGTKPVEQLWSEWKVENKREYESPEEEKRRFEIFKDAKKRIDAHNEKFKRGEVTFTMGLTTFADRTTEEFKSSHGLKVPKGAAGSV